MGAFGQNSSNSLPIDMYGGQSKRQAQYYNQNFARPFGQAFGMDPSQRFLEHMNSAADSGDPFAGYLRSTRALIPQVGADASRAGQDIAARAPGAFNQYMQQANGFLSSLPGLQSQMGQAAGAAQTGVERGTQFLNEAASPMQNQALFQQALRQSEQANNQGAAGHGLLDAGSTQNRSESNTRDLASQFAERQNTDRQAALGGLGQQAGLLSGITGNQAQLNAMGPEVSKQIMDALPQYAQLLMSGSQLPFQAAQQLAAFFGSAQNPTLGLLQATAPQIGSESKGWHA